jgi:UDP-N-acetylmuramyl pentapeptide phosphotransferase/UDP-N-acetylglucosamine-1-phosphate transferase
MYEITVKGLPAILIALIGAAFITWYFIPRVIRIVNERKLSDKPGKHKIHKRDIPTHGGIAIFGGFVFGYLLGVDGHIDGGTYVVAAALILFFTGLKDDLINLGPVKKIIAEIGAALLIAFFTGLRFTNFHGLAGMETIPVWLSYFITVFLVVLIINAVNLIDGIDGLAAAVGIIASAVFGTWFSLSGDYGYAIMAGAMLASLCVFIYYNISQGPLKIFMGDSGSLVLGFILAVFAIRFNEINAAGDGYRVLQSSPAVSIAILIVPLFDTLRVIVLRLYHGQSVFRADNRHTHHLMLRLGFTHLQATVIIAVFSLGIIALAFLLDPVGIFWLALIILGICVLAVFNLDRLVKRRERRASAMTASSVTAASVKGMAETA